MKKLTTLILFILLSFNLYSQKLKVEIDEFTGEKNISTSWEILTRDSDTGLLLYYSFLYKDNEIILQCISLYGAGTSIIVSSGSPLAIKFDNNNIVTLKSINYAIATKGGGADSGAFGSYQWDGVNVKYRFSSQDDANLFLKSLPSLVRFSYNSTQGGVYTDGKVAIKYANKIQKTYKMFIDEVNKLTE